MARVYSWEVSNSPKQYAYIVHPSDFTVAYIGNELSGEDLEKVANWASNCTDAEYERQFNLVKELCRTQNKNVEFEDVKAYMEVKSSCDNLRGPAGRGIDYIALTHSDQVQMTDTYTIFYDDGTVDSFFINHGKPGRDGVDGTPGAKGDDPVSTCFKMIYASGSYEDGTFITHTENGKTVQGPSTPTGGTYDFLLNKFTVPEGWSVNDSGLRPPIWMSSRTFTSSSASTDNNWSKPVQITGENGKPGEDGLNSEFIYIISDNQPDTPEVSENVPGYVPGDHDVDVNGNPIYVIGKWSPSPMGVDEDNRTEWSCIRRLKKVTNEDGSVTKEWGAWEKPAIWSKYGVNGQDGDGIQYMYLRNKGQFPYNPTPKGYDTNKDYQNKDTEWLPTPGVKYENYKGKEVMYEPLVDDIPATGETTEDGNTIYPPGVWTDNPTDVNVEFQYQWVCTRKYKTVTKIVDDKEKSVKEWTAYSEPSLWAKFGEQGKSATVIRKLYCLTQNTQQIPQVPTNSIETNEWGSGFPKDYVNGENVVWGTEAELWAHNNEFVKDYMLVSSVDENGVVIKPDKIITDEDKQKDPTITGLTNCITLSFLPDDEYKENGKTYKYVCFENQYYEWKTAGWSQPFLVSGMKGEDAKANDYITTAFVYGYANYPPERPNFSNPTALGTTLSIGGPSVYLQWEDYPYITKADSSIGIDVRIDGAIDKNNYERRWYQCQGNVNGYTGKIKEDGENSGIYLWGEVSPTTPKDGESIMGPYTEYRFAVTESETAPQVDDVRNPSCYNDEGIQCGWFTTSELLPKVPTGGAMWMINGIVDGQTDEMVSTNNRFWSAPTKVSGEKGEQGLPGPTGMRGTTGIPGASQNSLYCLGVDSKKDEWYFRGKDESKGDIYDYEERLIVSGKSSGYFGNNLYVTHSDGVTSKIQTKEIDNWYKGKDLPYSTPTEIEVKIENATNFGLTENNIKNAANKINGNYVYESINEQAIFNIIKSKVEDSSVYSEIGLGSVISVIISATEVRQNGTYDNVYYQYFLKTYDSDVQSNNGIVLKKISRILLPSESEEFCVYVWGIQGNDIIERNVSGVYEVNTDVAFVKGDNGKFSGNTINVEKLPDPLFYEETDPVNYRNGVKPSEYQDRKYIYNETSGFFYKWGFQDNRYKNIKVIPTVVDRTNSRFMTELGLEKDDIGMNGLPKHRYVSGETAYDYIIYTTKENTVIGENDCYKWRQFDGDTVVHGIKGVDWGSPFKLQGTNGLRGLEGARGQVIYPMGEYNMEEVYTCTTEKAPYVYDPNDGLFYVLDYVGANGFFNWVGKLPRIEDGEHFDKNYYKCVTVPPTDYIGNYVTYKNYEPGNGVEGSIKNDPMNPNSFSGGIIHINRDIEYPDGTRKAKYVRIENYRDINNKQTISTKGQDGEDIKFIGGKYEDYQYGRIIDAFFEFVEEDSNGNQTYKIAHTYKYKGVDGNWMAEQEGRTPSQHYANKKEDNRTPLWTRFETFQALYASVGIIANGLIGSAVFNNEFMFSQQGTDYAGNETEYKTVSSSGYKYGFLSGYEYDEDGVNIGNREYHWHYAGTRYYLSEIDVDPYKKVKIKGGYENSLIDKTSLIFRHKTYGDNFEDLIKDDVDCGKLKDGTICYINVHPVDSEDVTAASMYLHTFMPNTCINFASGEMWNSCGKVHFGHDGTGYLADNAIKWWFDTDGSICMQIGRDGDNGLRLTRDGLTFGQLEEYKEEIKQTFENTSNELTKTFEDSIEETRLDLMLQVDKKAETYYGENNPEVENEWVVYDNDYHTVISDEREKHVGDMFYYTGEGNSLFAKNTTYRYDHITGETFYRYKNTDNPSEVFWINCKQNLSELMFKFNNNQLILLNSSEKEVVIRNLLEITAITEYIGINIGRIVYLAQDGDVEKNISVSYYKWVMQNIPKSVFDQIDGKSAIFVTKPIEDKDGDGFLYKEKDMWLLEKDYTEETELGDSGKMGSIWVAKTSAVPGEFDFNDWEKKGTELDNWVKGDYADELFKVNTQIDKKADCYYQSEDPSEGWQANDSSNYKTYAPERIGDIWYNIETSIAYTFASKNILPRNNKPTININRNIAGSIDSKVDGYHWVESNVPSGVFDRLDGKSTIFVTEPNKDNDEDGYFYHEGDMYLSGNTISGGGELMRAIRSNTTGYTSEDWVKASKYTDDETANAAIDRLNAYDDDDHVSPSEQGVLRDNLKIIEKEYPSITATCASYGLTASTNSNYSKYTAYTKSYSTVIETLKYYSGQYNDYSEDEYNTTNDKDEFFHCIKIKYTGSYTGTTYNPKDEYYKYYGNIADYYKKKLDLQNSVIDISYQTANDAHSEAQQAINDATNAMNKAEEASEKAQAIDGFEERVMLAEQAVIEAKESASKAEQAAKKSASDATSVNNKLKNWASDSILIHNERVDLKKLCDEIVNETASTYNYISRFLGDTDANKYKNSAIYAYKTAKFYAYGGSATGDGVTIKLGTLYDVSTATTENASIFKEATVCEINGGIEICTTYRHDDELLKNTKLNYDNIKNYQDTKSNLMLKVSSKIGEDAIKYENYEFLRNTFGTVNNFSGATLTNHLSVQDSKGYIRAYMDGAGLVNDSTDGKLILALGIKTGVTSENGLAERAKTATIRMYEKGKLYCTSGQIGGFTIGESDLTSTADKSNGILTLSPSKLTFEKTNTTNNTDSLVKLDVNSSTSDGGFDVKSLLSIINAETPANGGKLAGLEIKINNKPNNHFAILANAPIISRSIVASAGFTKINLEKNTSNTKIAIFRLGNITSSTEWDNFSNPFIVEVTATGNDSGGRFILLPRYDHMCKLLNVKESEQFSFPITFVVSPTTPESSKVYVVNAKQKNVSGETDCKQYIDYFPLIFNNKGEERHEIAIGKGDAMQLLLTFTNGTYIAYVVSYQTSWTGTAP